jgi:NAD(P)-dependent dehydrogenase (short-subunit alcohol dehydrogenase family)
VIEEKESTDGRILEALEGQRGSKMESRKIVISGTTSGLGLALWHRFVALGHEVHGCGRRELQLASLGSSPAQRSFTRLDVTNWNEVSAWGETICRSGAPDLLITNAAQILAPTPLWQVDVAACRQLLDTNLMGVVHLIRAFVPAMVEAGRGVIVLVSSGWGRSVDAGVAPYCASKWGIEGLAQALAEELPRGLAAVAFNPGVIDTPMLRQVWGDRAAAFWAAGAWAERAAPLLLALAAGDNGRSLSLDRSAESGRVADLG